ncbi:MAG TPA: NDP-sugar synthase [Candidatus Brocadiia bacterium]|nr:NDP-sugar synthase [Candidatus Brocadiia bacterium]
MITAIIPAAGEGKRMWPYGVTKNKAYLPVAARPLICRTVETLKKIGIREIIVVVGYRREQIAHAVGAIEGVCLVEQSSAAPGTATAVLSGWRTTGSNEALVVYGDCLIAEEDLRALITAFDEGKPGAALLTAKLPEYERSNDWLCVSPGSGATREVRGHPRNGSHRIAGAFCFDRRFFSCLERNPGVMHGIEVGMMSPTLCELGESVNVAIQDGMEVAAVEAKHHCVDLDKPWHIMEANERYLNYAAERVEKSIIPASAKIHDSAEIDGKIILGENVVIGKNVRLGDCVWVGDGSRITEGAMVDGRTAIGRGCTVKRYCQISGGTSLGDECYAGHCTEVDGVMFRKSYAYHYGEYWGVIGQNTDLGAATVCGTLRFDDLDTQHIIAGHKEALHPAGNASFLGDYCRTGVNVILLPGVKVGPYSVIGPGTILNEDVPDGTCVYVKQELIRKKWGPERYGW